MNSNSNQKPVAKATVNTSAPPIDILDPTGTLEAHQIKHIEDLVEKASVLHKEIDIEQGKTAVKIIWQGCHLYVVDDALTVIEDETIREEIYGKLLVKYGIARKTADQRILLVKRMM